MMPKTNPKSLYIHIPFCDHICSYCDFTKLFYNEKFAKKYIESLVKEIDSYNITKVDTIYFGGGTPTSLSDVDLDFLLKKVHPFLSINAEFTVEANVENLTESKLKILKDNGVNRLSIGVQSTSNKTLKEIGRHHTFEDAKNVVSKAKQYGFANINVDLIYGFKGQSKEDLLKDLKNIISLDVDHISIYSLIVDKGSILYNKKYQEQNEDDSRDYYDLILKTLREAKYERYEVSNFARNNKYSRHNLTYWRNEEYYGVGLGASGYVNKIRYTNTKSLDTYVSGNYIAEKEEVDLNKEKEYFLITNLRLERGFSLKKYSSLFDEDFLFAKQNIINKLIKDKLVQIDDDFFRLTDEGMMIMDRILIELI